MQVSANPSPSQPLPASAAEDRRAIKEIARDVQKQGRRLDRVPDILDIKIEPLQNIVDRLEIRKEQLALLSARPLSTEPPPSGTMRNARSRFTMASAALTRAGATAAAGAVAVVEGSARLPGLMATVTASFAGLGIELGWNNMNVACAKPVTAVVGLGVGAATGFVVAFAVTPSRLATRGSLTRSSFSLLDQWPKARAHVARKKMSTADIASGTHAELESKLVEANAYLKIAKTFRDKIRYVQE